jgi:hypothetical protein
MDLDSFVANTRERGIYFLAQRDRQAEEDDEADRPPLVFSIQAIVDECGEDYVAEAIHFFWSEFLEVFSYITKHLQQSGSGRRHKLAPIDQSFIILLYLTKGFYL